MRPLEEFDLVMKLVASGLNDCEIARTTGVNRRTVLDWRHKGHAGWRPGFHSGARSACPRCDKCSLDEPTYAYLLGLYLGDGWLTGHPRAVYRLRIVQDEDYTNIIRECIEAVDRIKMHGRRALQVKKEGCIEISSYWKHWICLFPQHGPGPKHSRNIQLEHWQLLIAEKFPERLIRGLIHSDGCRFVNRVGTGYEYVNYAFTNNSKQIQTIFTDACDQLGIRWRRSSWKSVTISRRPDVAKLDAIVGPKT